MIAALWSLVVLAGTLDDAVAVCDAKVIGLPPAERDYACYASLAREPDVAHVLGHVQGLLEEHPDDGRLWLTLAALQGDHGRESEPALRRAIAELARAEQL